MSGELELGGYLFSSSTDEMMVGDTSKSALEHRHKEEYGYFSSFDVKEELSLERGESSSFVPPEYSDETDESDIDVVGLDAPPKTELDFADRQKFRRWRHKEYQCDECDRMFTLKHNLQNHFAQYHMGCKTLHKACPSCKCTICGKIYSAASVLAEHMLYEHDKRIQYHQCSVCDEKFIVQSSLMTHMRKHTRVIKTCPYKECAGLSFKFTKELSEHVRLEHKLAELTCSVCNMVFRQLSTKIKHEQTHNKEGNVKEVAPKREMADQEAGERRPKKAKCDEDLVKREEPSHLLESPRFRHRHSFVPEIEAMPIKRKQTKRLTKAEILAKIKD